jgi:hypothetical protein
MTTLENYPLGHSEAEAKRLMEQGAMLERYPDFPWLSEGLRKAGLPEE